MIRLVVTDLDGTLWLGDGAVSADDEGGDPGTGAPGDPAPCRNGPPVMVGGALPRQAELDLPAVLLNGALGRDKGGEPTFNRRALDPADALAALDVFERHGVTPGANFESKEWDVVSGPAPSSGERYVVWAGSHLRLVSDLRAMVAALPVTRSPWSPARKRKRSGAYATSSRQPAVSGSSMCSPTRCSAAGRSTPRQKASTSGAASKPTPLPRPRPRRRAGHR